MFLFVTGKASATDSEKPKKSDKEGGDNEVTFDSKYDPRPCHNRYE